MLRSHGKRGGWITFPFIAATLTGVVLSGWGWTANLILYLIEVFHVKSIAATQIANIVNGSFNLLPIAAAILADSYFGCFSVIAVFTGLSFLGIVLLTLTASVNSLRPSPCETGSTSCQFPSSLQFAMLYAAIVLASIGFGAMRFILATMGGNQFMHYYHLLLPPLLCFSSWSVNQIQIKMDSHLILFLLLFIQFYTIPALTDNLDSAALTSLKDACNNLPPNWMGSDPCADAWVGIKCTDSRVDSITLANMGLEGQLSGDISSLTELRTLDLSYNQVLL